MLARWRVNRHLRSCAGCRQAVEGYRSSRRELAASGEVPEVDFSALVRQVRAAHAADPGSRPLPARPLLVAAAATAAAGLWLVLAPTRQGRLPEATVAAPSELAEEGALLGLDGRETQIGENGQLSLRAYHSQSGILSITEYYAP